MTLPRSPFQFIEEPYLARLYEKLQSITLPSSPFQYMAPPSAWEILPLIKEMFLNVTLDD